MKLCKNCKYRRTSAIYLDICTHGEEEYINPVDGKRYWKNSFRSMKGCENDRMYGDCGVDAKFFEKRRFLDIFGM